MDQCFIDLMFKGEQINLPALMIKHIARIANTTKEHDLGYGFLLTQVFEFFGVELRKSIEAQVIDKIGNSTHMGCGFELVQGTVREAEQGAQTPAPPVPRGTAHKLSMEGLQQEQQFIQSELATIQRALAEEKELSAKCHNDLLALFAALNAKLSPPAP